MPETLTIIHAPTGSLRANGFNVNVVSPENEAKIDASLARFGFFKPILCRDTLSGLEILGGEHRWHSARRLGLPQVPVINLGQISDQRAKEIALVDNGRYGNDDTLQLAQLLEELGNLDDLASFMPYSDADLASIFSSTAIELDDLDLPDDDATSAGAAAATAEQTHQLMRFRVPVGDAGWIGERIATAMKQQGFTDEDSLTNAGHALVHLLQTKRS